MKTFSAFLNEAVVSRAVEKAKRMGLVSDGSMETGMIVRDNTKVELTKVIFF